MVGLHPAIVKEDSVSGIQIWFDSLTTAIVKEASISRRSPG
jgi:hypothetical protein